MRGNLEAFNHPSLGLGEIFGIVGIQRETRYRSLAERKSHAKSGNHQKSFYHVVNRKPENLASQRARKISALWIDRFFS